MESTVNNRIRDYLKFKGIIIQQFEISIERTNGYLSHTKSPTANVLSDIIRVYSDLNIEWLITGYGQMLKTEKHNYVSIASEPSEQYQNTTQKYIQQLENENKRLISENQSKQEIIDSFLSGSIIVNKKDAV